MDWTNLIISLISGIVGGNVVGAAAPDKSLGGVGNSVTGLLGGAGGGYILQALGLFAQAMNAAGTAGAAPSMDIGAIIGNIAGSGVGGAILTYVVGLIKSSFSEKK